MRKKILIYGIVCAIAGALAVASGSYMILGMITQQNTILFILSAITCGIGMVCFSFKADKKMKSIYKLLNI